MEWSLADVATHGGHLEDPTNLELANVSRPRMVGVERSSAHPGVISEDNQLSGGGVGLLAAEVHVLKANPLLQPFLVRRRPQFISLSLEILELFGQHLVGLPADFLPKFGVHPAYSLPSRIDALG